MTVVAGRRPAPAPSRGLAALKAPSTPSRGRWTAVTVDPGARTAWHTHPLGQTLLVTAGLGLCQSNGRPVRPGDVATFAPDERHWHGAAPETAMSHIAVPVVRYCRRVAWLEPVSDADYGSTPEQ